MRGQKWPNAPLTPPFSTPGAVNAALLFDRALDIAQHVHSWRHKFKKENFNKKTVSSNDNTVPMIVIITDERRGRKQ